MVRTIARFPFIMKVNMPVKIRKLIVRNINAAATEYKAIMNVILHVTYQVMSVIIGKPIIIVVCSIVIPEFFLKFGVVVYCQSKANYKGPVSLL